MDSSKETSYGPFSICSKDYMNNSNSFQQLRQRVGDYLLKSTTTGTTTTTTGTTTTTTTTNTQMDDIILVTMPRLFQYNFNPLNIYFILNTDYILLEVNNTFGEGHLYLLNLKEEKLKVKRDFHVSPFNQHNDGEYQFTIKQEHTPEGLKYFYVNILYEGVMNASLELNSCENYGILPSSLPPLPPLTTSYLLTFIRILYQAFILAYIKHLRIYNKPPLSISKESVKRINSSQLEEYCLEILSQQQQQQQQLFQLESTVVRIKDYEVVVMLCLCSSDYKRVMRVYHHYEYFEFTSDGVDLDMIIESLESTSSFKDNQLLYYFELYFVSHFLFPSSSYNNKSKERLLLPKLSVMNQLYLIGNGLLLFLYYLFFSLITPFHKTVKNAPWEKSQL